MQILHRQKCVQSDRVLSCECLYIYIIYSCDVNRAKLFPFMFLIINILYTVRSVCCAVSTLTSIICVVAANASAC